MATYAAFALVPMMFSTISAEKAWVSWPIIRPTDLIDDFTQRYHYAPIGIGNPPQIQHLAISLHSLPVYLFSPNCVFCPVDNMYNPLISNSFKLVDSEKWPWGAPEFEAQVVTDDIVIEGILTSRSQEFGLVNYFSREIEFRPREGVLGLAVEPFGRASNRYSLLHNLHKNEGLLNPVIGMDLGGNNPHLTIGALNPDDYEGEINWIERVEANATQAVIPVEALRGDADQILPFSYPLHAILDTLEQEISLPDDRYYFFNESYIGPQGGIYRLHGPMLPDSYGVECTVTDFDAVHIPFSVDINGVNYPVDSKELLRQQSPYSTNHTCRVGLRNSTVEGGPITLGLPFLRSIYLAYRFPTEDCPYGHYGFAYRKGSNRTSATISQKPRTTPSHASQCLQLVAPTSTPSSKQVNFFVKHQNEQFDLGASETTYKVWGRPDEPPTPLRGVNDLPGVIVGLKKSWL